MASSYLASLHQDGPSGIVYPGGCYLQNELIRCALDEFHCQGLKFRSARQMQEALLGGDGAADRCRRPHPDYVGMCTSGIDNFHCTGHSSACVITSKFVSNVPYCTLKHSHFPGRDTHLALYGSCSTIEDDSSVSRQCVWSMDDCDGAGMEDGTVTYTAVAFANDENADGIIDADSDDLCTCDRVRTGACVFNDDWTCAVSADACDMSSSYRTRKEVSASGRDCRLCESFDKTQVVSTDRVQAWRNDGSHSGSNNNHNNHNNHNSNNASVAETGNACQAGIAAGAAVASVLFVLLVTLIVTVLCRDGRRGSGSSSGGGGNNDKTNEPKPEAANCDASSTEREREETSFPRDGQLA